MRRAPEPPEGSPEDWYARGYRQGIADGSGAAVRELASLRTHARPVAERAAEVAELANSVVTNLDHLIEQTNAQWGKAQFHPDRWEPHPMYLLGAEMFRRSYEDKANGRSSNVRSGRKIRSRNKAEPPPAEPCPTLNLEGAAPAAPPTEPGPTLNLDAALPATDPDAGLCEEERMRRAAGQAWRA